MTTHVSRVTLPLPGWSPTTWLAGTAMGTYLLVVVGAVTGLAGERACGGWPTCDGQWIVPFTDLGRTVAWSHRLVTLMIGLALCWTAVRVWQTGRRRVRLATLVALALFPPQVAIGAAAASSGTTTALAAAHLVLAMVLFAALVAALAWRLEAVTPDDSGGDTAIPPPSDDGSSTVPDTTACTALAPLAVVRAYLELTKPKLMWLLCLVALASMALVSGPSLPLETVAATLVGGVLAVGASGTFNNVIERDADGRMERTADRPLPTERIPVRNALAFGGLLTVASLATFLAFVNVLAAALGLLAILYYSVGYTLVLKPRTDQSVVVGGAVGAFPALIGWAAVTGTIGLPALVLGAVVFLWTPAHFYNLALAHAEDYAAAGFPMLPVVRDEATTRKHVLRYLGATLVGSAALGTFAALDALYAATAVVAGGLFLWAVVGLHRERTDAAAFRAFHAANAYLGALLLAVVVDASLL